MSALARQAMEAEQLARLNGMLPLLAWKNIFYGLRVQAAGLTWGAASLQDFVARMPFTTKMMLARDQLVHPPHGSNLTFPLDAYTRYNQTSATTSGRPMRWLDTPEGWAWMLENWREVLRAAGVERGDRVFFAFSFGPFLGFWTAFEAALSLGCLCIPGGGMSSAARLGVMRDNRATVLCCTPTYALRLAEVAAQEGPDARPEDVRRIIVAGEPGGSVPATRARIEQGWPSARVFDHHGMTEVGPVSHECPGHPGRLLILEQAYLAEVVDPSGDAACAEGELGELVLTTLGRVGSPLLRYRTGDLVRWTYHDVDGTPRMALEGGILDRCDDMVIVRGVNVFPSALDAVLRTFEEVVEYQANVSEGEGLTQLHLRVEPAEGIDHDDLSLRLGKALREAFHLRIPVEVTPPGTLPRFEMKARRWTRQKEGKA